jgi:hypothetical protein
MPAAAAAIEPRLLLFVQTSGPHLNSRTTATCTTQKLRQMMILTTSRAMTMIAKTSSQKTVNPRLRE